MANKQSQKIGVERLENPAETGRIFTEDELLEILTSDEKLRDIAKSRVMLFVGSLFVRMKESKKFKEKVLALAEEKNLHIG